MKWLRPVLSFVFVALAAAGIWYWRQRPVFVEVEVAEARAAAVVADWAATGYVECRTADVTAPQVGRIVEVTVREGDRVRAGQVLAKLVSDTERSAVRVQEEGVHAARADAAAADAAVEEADSVQRDRIVRAGADVNAARERLRQAEATLGRSRKVARANLDAAKADHAAAESRLRDLEKGSRPEEIQQAEADVESAVATEKRARQELARQRRLLKDGAVARRVVDDAEEAHRRGEASLKRSRAGLQLLKKGNRPDAIAAARAQMWAAAEKVTAGQAEIDGLDVDERRVDEARAALQAMQAGLAEAKSSAKRVQTLRHQARSAQAAIRRGQASVSQARTTLAERTLVAAFDGVIGRRFVDPGDLADLTRPLFTLLEDDRAWVAAEVDEQDLAPVRVGQAVVITSPAYPGREFAGRVESIGAEAIPQTQVRTGARIVRVRISLASAPAADRALLKPGMEVHVAGESRLAERGVLIPSDALLADREGSFVFIVEGAGEERRVRKRRVRAGFVAGRETEILEGLQDGDRVVVSGKEGLQEGTAVRLAGGG